MYSHWWILIDGNIYFLLEAAFSSMIEGKNEEMSTSELSGGARIHYIFQSIFVKSLEVCFFNNSTSFGMSSVGLD